MAQSFPTELQDKFNESGFSTKLGDNTITSDVAVGLPKKRSRYTQAIDTITGTINLNIDDWLILKTFYTTTLAGGVLTFNYNDPMTQVLSEYRFQEPPQARPLGGKWFVVSFNWLEMP